MVYLVCGVGQAGGRLVDEMFAHKNFRRIAKPLAINSTLKDLQTLKNIRPGDWAGVSESKGMIPGTTPGFERYVVGGFGKDPTLAGQVMEKNQEKTRDFFLEYSWSDSVEDVLDGGMEAEERRPQKETSDDWEVAKESIPFALVVFGAGGGTGSGTTPWIIKALREVSSVATTVIAVAILPATRSATGGTRGAHRQAWNTRVSLQLVEKHADGIILVDNQCLGHHPNLEQLFPSYNKYVARALVDLLSAHLLDGVRLDKLTDASLPVIDIQDIRTAISFGSGQGGKSPGYASLGWHLEPLKSLGGYMMPGLGRRHPSPEDLAEAAFAKQTLADVDVQEARKNLALVRIPSSMAKKHKKTAEYGRFEELLGGMSKSKETHFGITVGKRKTVSIATLFTYTPAQVKRLAEIKQMAAEYEQRGG